MGKLLLTFIGTAVGNVLPQNGARWVKARRLRAWPPDGACPNQDDVRHAWRLCHTCHLAVEILEESAR